MNTQDEFSTPAVPGQPGDIINTSALRFPVYPYRDEGALLVGVLKRGQVEDVAVYVGVLDRDDGTKFGTDSPAARWIAANGSKVTYRQALMWFPSIPEGWYRA